MSIHGEYHFISAIIFVIEYKIPAKGANDLIKKIIAWVIAIILSTAILILIAFQLSPRPGAYLINKMFDSPIEITDKEKYEESSTRVSVLEDIDYDSEYERNNFDIYYPKDATERVPVIFWVHGGGYVGGDKSGVTEFATNIASDANVAVITLNYELAPDSEYPGQINQIDDAYRFIEKNLDEYSMIDLDQIFFGGDSAGAQIALQYVTIQTNREYAEQMNMEQTIQQTKIKGAISYCGPVNLKQTVEEKSDSKFLRFFVKTVAWSLIGEKNWQDTPQLQEASLVSHVTEDFPPTYITDGNAFSFPQQGIELEEQLKSLQVSVSSLFFVDSPEQINHEYQFDYRTKEAKLCYEQTLSFINQYK